MKYIKSEYIGDGPCYHKGMPGYLAKAEDAEGFDKLMEAIISSNLYGKEYFENVTGQKKITADNMLMAAILDFFGPSRLAELGCGAASDLMTASLSGKTDVCGIDFSQEIIKDPWPGLEGKLHCGDVEEVLLRLAKEGERFDMILALDIWEHFTPASLQAKIKAMLEACSEDALFFFVIPAFGKDKIFGEIFPLEFEENREAFDARRPFDHIPLNSEEDPIPKSGHLILAHTEWWEKTFRENGLERQLDLEVMIHKYFGPHMYYARRTFYVLRRNTEAARARAENLAGAGRLTFSSAALKTMAAFNLASAYEKEHAPGAMDKDLALEIMDRMHSSIRQALKERILHMMYKTVDKIDGANPHLRPEPVKSLGYAMRWTARTISSTLSGPAAAAIRLGHKMKTSGATPAVRPPGQAASPASEVRLGLPPPSGRKTTLT